MITANQWCALWRSTDFLRTMAPSRQWKDTSSYVVGRGGRKQEAVLVVRCMWWPTQLVVWKQGAHRADEAPGGQG